jgi:hypothetical protein
MGDSAGRLLMAIGGGALLLTAILLGRRGDDRRAFTCAIAAALVLTPVVWMHYLALLAVPLALARPRFSAVWLLPIVLWVCPRSENGDGLQTFLPAIVSAVLVGVILARERPRRSSVPAPIPTAP